MSQNDDRQWPQAQPDPPAAPAMSGAPAAGYRISVRRDGCVVNISLVATNEYSSIELYERLVQSAKSGHFRLDVGVPRP